MGSSFLRQNQGGYTLIELMLSLGISSVLLYGIHGVLMGQQKAYVQQEQIVEAQEGLRIAATLMNREIRMAGYNPTGTADAKIVTAEKEKIHITSDLDGNGDTIGSNENITYAVYTKDGIKKLGRTVNGSKAPVLEHLESLEFVYRKADGTPLALKPDGTLVDPAQISQVKKIEIILTARTATADPQYPKNQGYRTRALTSYISLRN
ncbi:MAG: PilW family protein [Nitrospiria bacterium]